MRIYIQYALNIPIFHVQIRQNFMSTTGSYIATYKTSQCGSFNRARVYAIFTYKSDAMQKMPFFQSSKNGIWTRFQVLFLPMCICGVQRNDKPQHNLPSRKFKRRTDSLDKKTMLWQTKLFLKDYEPIIPPLVKASGCFILSDISTETVTVSKCLEANASFLMSPLCKKKTNSCVVSHLVE